MTPAISPGGELVDMFFNMLFGIILVTGLRKMHLPLEKAKKAGLKHILFNS